MLVCTSQEDVQKILHVKHIIEKDYRYHLTHQQLASRVGTNESKLRQLFKQMLNTTMYDYLVRVRIEKAKELLSDTGLPIKMIADRVGYDIRSFNRQFKKVMKVSPLVWRKHLWSASFRIEDVIASVEKTDLTIS